MRSIADTILFIHRTIIQYLSTVDTDTFSCPFAHCAFSLAMATPVRRTFTTDAAADASWQRAVYSSLVLTKNWHAILCKKVATPLICRRIGLNRNNVVTTAHDRRLLVMPIYSSYWPLIAQISATATSARWNITWNLLSFNIIQILADKLVLTLSLLPLAFFGSVFQ